MTTGFRVLGNRPSGRRSRLIGRDGDLSDVVALLGRSRLVTITGPGGAGKTRLAGAVCEAADPLAPAGVAWIELAPIIDPLGVVDAIRAGLGIPEVAGQGVDVIVEQLGGAELLLCLDNCEQVIAAAAAVVDLLLDACPGLRVLATSREPLAVDGESIWPLAPLSVPPPDTTTARGVLSSATGELFELRARSGDPSFHIGDGDAAAATRLCRLTGGLPLAVELAAARTRTLSVAQIVAGLDNMFQLLSGGSRTAPSRQRSLRATLDWSHDLLSEPERVVFRRLGALPGGFDLEAAGAVVGDVPDELLDVLARLVDRSLVRTQRSGEQVRYRLLSPIRRYAREQLIAAGEADAAAMRHLAHYAELVELVEPLLSGPDQVRELDRLELEGANLRAALGFAARSSPVPREGLRLAAGVWRLCALRGHYREGRYWLDWAAGAATDADPVLRAKALLGSGSLAHLQCDYPAATGRLEAALALYRAVEDKAGTAAVVQVLGSVARERGEYARAESLHREALALACAADDRLRAAQNRGLLGFVAWLQCHWQEAIDQCEAALDEFRALGDGEGIVWSLLSLGTVARYRHEDATAAELLTEAADLSDRLGYREGLAWTAHQLGALALQRGDPAGEAMLLDALAGHRALGDRWRAASVMADLAGAALDSGAPRRAVSLLGAAAAIRADIGTDIAPCDRTAREQVETELRAKLPAEEFARAWTHGQSAPLDELLATDADAATSAAAQVVSAAEPEVLRIRALGQTTVSFGGRSLEPADWGYAKPRELFFLLISSPPQAKTEIGAALWPELDGPQLRNAFHTALRDLRRALGDPGWVRFAGGRYLIDRTREYWCDLDIFEEALAAARNAQPAGALPHLRRAIAAYGGTFGAGLPDAEWTRDRAAQLDQRYARALAAAGRLLVEEGQLAEAARIFRRAVEHDPLDESASRHLMTTLVAVGESARAAQVYQELAARLRDELGVSPAAQTTVIYRQLLRS